MILSPFEVTLCLFSAQLRSLYFRCIKAVHGFFFPRDTFFIVKDTEGEPHQKLTDLIQVGTEKKLITFSPF